MAAFTASQASVTNGSKVVTINSGESIANIRQGDFLFLAGFLVEINRGYVGGSSQQYIELVRNWTNSSQSNQPALVVPTTGDFRAAVDAINNANKNVNDNLVAMQNWQTKMGSVTFVNQDGSTTNVKTLKQIEADNEAQMDAYHPYPWAMRKVEFEARRAANNEKFAASGFVHFGKHRNNTAAPVAGTPVNEGMWVKYDSTQRKDSFCLGAGPNISYLVGNSKTNNPVLHIAGVLTELSHLSEVQADISNTIKLPPAEDGNRTYDSATGVSVTHATPAIAFASETTTNKVVTDRPDMWGLEAFLREINDADPFVYKNGLIQSQATSINGVPTVTDNVRPITYFSWYEGDNSSRGKGVNWQTATEAERIAIASDPENNIYFDDATGNFYQWCVRGRSFAGQGNGDWSLLDPASPLINGASALSFDDGNIGTIGCQGTKDAVVNYDRANGGRYIPAVQVMHTPYNGGIKSELGVYTAANGIGNYNKPNTSVAVDGECFFLVCGTVNRLNKGAYHPSHNSFGSDLIQDNAGNTTAARTWSEDRAKQINSTQDAFLLAGSTSGLSWGSISSGFSGRPDGRYYDAIYASGKGGVCRDMRYSAWGLTQEDFADADLAVKSGEYRGREKVGLTKLLPISDSPTVTSSNIGVRAFNNLAIELGIDVQDAYYVYNVTNGELFYNLDRRETLQGSFTSHIYYPEAWGNSPSVILIYILKQATVAGEFLHTDVIGDPAKIILCDDLKDGWVGDWIPNIPEGIKDNFQLSRPYAGLGTGIQRTFTVNNGASWSSAKIQLSLPISNETVFTNMPANQVTIYQYDTEAKKVSTATNSSVYAGVEGLGYVWGTSFYAVTWGRDLAFSATGKLLTNGFGTGKINSHYKLDNFALRPTTNTLDHNNSREPEHQILDLAGDVGDVAFKALNYNVVENQQGFINYAYTSLKHDGTDYGDDGKIHIVDGQSTMLDENGNTVLVGTARCVEPLGWIKNDK
ncbi:hypothetical protein WNY63_16940 [Pseudoalteromonas neustonica]|uniref:Tail fiber protein n=1 Tax=Pseudoalteromonas neustonica TaxID=1840331 RepID=A0ABU9U5V9_9GAMM